MNQAPGPAAASAPRLTRRSLSVAETERLGEGLAPALEPGDLVSLGGPLGAGKTRLVAGLARGLGYPGQVRSPSFTLVNEYRGRLLLLHLDLYRVDGMDVDALGIDEHLERGALVVEWGEKLPAHWSADALRLDLELVSERERRITAAASHRMGGSRRGLVLLEAWQALPAGPPADSPP